MTYEYVGNGVGYLTVESPVLEDVAYIEEFYKDRITEIEEDPFYFYFRITEHDTFVRRIKLIKEDNGIEDKSKQRIERILGISGPYDGGQDDRSSEGPDVSDP